ncbi:hypothetical protein PIB30_042290 [Stylosanthes scabra]|uniref:EF-hand domain-containing protein n=1 Tax=Stylosanthes scabra TaxID=79078 RepID=A0ABU6VDZ3_9FABA|nr:hypothetical protein [Stylosanthes scabra]
MSQAGFLSVELESLKHVLRLVEAFRAFDSDNDGNISEAELGGIMGSIGYKTSDQEMRAMMQQGDKNKDGLMSMGEFLELNTKHLEMGNLSSILKAAFEELDNEDENDVLTGEELHEVMGNLGLGLSLERCQNIVNSLDFDGDGAVTLDEFRVIVDSLL